LLAQTPVFRSDSQLVELSVVALDRKGQPVKDLKPGDIEIQDGNQRRAVALLRFEGVTPSPAPPAVAAKSRLFTNHGERAVTDKHVVAIVIDALNTSSTSQTRVLAFAARYLRELAPNSLVAIYQLGEKIRVVHDFTSDGDALRARLAAAKPKLGAKSEDIAGMIEDANLMLDLLGDQSTADDARAVSGEMKAVVRAVDAQSQANANERRSNAMATLNGLNAIGAHLAAIPGRKSLVWIGDGIANVNITTGVSLSRGFGTTAENWADSIRNAGRRLAQYGVTVYAVDSRGLGPRVGASGEPVNIYQQRQTFGQMQGGEDASTDTRWAATELVEPTGGRAIRDTNDLNAGLRRASADLEGSYSLAFYSTAKPDGKWHPVKLKCRRADVQLFSRAGYLAELAPQSSAWGEAEWKALIANPLPANSLAVDAQCSRAANGQLELTLFVDPRHLAFGEARVAQLDVALAEKQASGEFVFKAQSLKLQQPANVEQPLGLFRGVWKPEPATSVVRLAVRDRRAGRLGVVDVPLARVAVASAK
jgi:VWFA-related protein